jgi:hypothetical protein
MILAANSAPPDHADPERSQCHADACRRQPEGMHRIGHVDSLDHEQCRVENELGDKDRPQQPVAEDERCTFAQLTKRMPRRPARMRRLTDASEQDNGTERKHRGKSKRGPAADPPHQCSTQRGPGRERGRARELDPPIGNRKGLRFHQRWDQRRGGHAVSDRAARPDESKDGEQGQTEPSQGHQREDEEQRQYAQNLCPRHQTRARHAVCPNARRNRKQQKRHVCAVCRRPVAPSPAFSIRTATIGAAARPTCSAD